MAKKKDQSKRYERLQNLAGKAKVELEKILKVIGTEADLGSKFLKRKISLLSIDTDIEKKYIELGKETYNMVNEGKITEERLSSISGEIDKLYNKIGQTKKEMDVLKEQMKIVSR